MYAEEGRQHFLVSVLFCYVSGRSKRCSWLSWRKCVLAITLPIWYLTYESRELACGWEVAHDRIGEKNLGKLIFNKIVPWVIYYLRQPCTDLSSDTQTLLIHLLCQTKHI